MQGGDSFHPSDEGLSPLQRTHTPGGNRHFNESVSVCGRRRNALAAFQGFKLFEGAGPIGPQQARKAAIGEDFAAGLAGGAVVGFVVGVANALDGAAATRAGLAEAAVDRHFGAKGGDVFGEFCPGFGREPCNPKLQRRSRGVEKAPALVWREFVRERDGREACGVENLVGIGVADAADEARVSEGALEGAVLEGERGTKAVKIGGEDFDAAGIDVAEGLLAADEMKRGAALGAGFG